MIKLRKFKWKYEDLDGNEHLDDEYVRLFFTTSFFWYLIGNSKPNNIFHIFVNIVMYILLTIWGLYCDLFMLPFKLLYSIKIK